MNRLMYTILLSIITLIVFPVFLSSQTCSCAGNPSFDPSGLSFDNENKWNLEFSYTLHSINDLVSKDQEIVNDVNRRRTVKSFFLKTGYSISSRFSISTILSFIRQERRIGSNNNSFDRLNGIGDSMVAFSYSALKYSLSNPVKISVGSGIKIPTGSSQVLLTGLASEDMQPGTGSWDLIFWGKISYRNMLFRNSDLFLFGSFRKNGENSREYSFGEESILSSGILLYPHRKFSLSFEGRYIRKESDRRFIGDIPNTGGIWINLIPEISYKFTDSMGFKTRIEIPVYRNLNGTEQFTTSYLISVSIFRQF
ncbi:MAG: hypothetical protein KAR14_06560 [Candidatus Aminicenantes bacterium]|nr:hypothetical protein [Candidatus Aminicenantes bacterium]